MKIAFDASRCVQCGLCFGVCPRLSPGEAGSKSFKVLLEKCDECAGLRSLRCVDACPHNVLRLEYDEEEQKELSHVVGWRKAGPRTVCETLESADNYEIVEAKGGRFLLTGLEELSLDEARLARAVLDVFRSSDEAFTDQHVESLLESTCVEKGVCLSEKQAAKILGFVEAEACGFSVLSFLLGLPRLEEIVVVSEKMPVFVYHEEFGWLETDVVINSKRKIVDLANKIARPLGRRLSFRTPTINACLSFGRLHAAIPPASASACLTLRLFRRAPFTLEQFVQNKTLSRQAAALLKLAAVADTNLLIIGNTASGKTSLLNALASLVPRNQRVVIVEETPEVRLPHKNQVRLVAGDAGRMNELIAETLRMRPDRLIVGEVRSAAEAKALANCLLAGQGKGLFATMHAETAEDAFKRLESFGLEPGFLRAVDLIVTIKRWSRSDADVRRVTEVCGVEKHGPAALFKYDDRADALVKIGQFAQARVFAKLQKSVKAYGREGKHDFF